MVHIFHLVEQCKFPYLITAPPSRFWSVNAIAIFIFFLFTLSTCHMERMIKFKDYLMFRPKNRQTLLKISTLNKFLHVFYNHKYYSFYIYSNLAYSYTTSQSSANTSDEEGTHESALPSGLIINI